MYTSVQNPFLVAGGNPMGCSRFAFRIILLTIVSDEVYKHLIKQLTAALRMHSYMQPFML